MIRTVMIIAMNPFLPAFSLRRQALTFAFLLLAMGLSALTFTHPSWAASSEWAKTEQGAVRLVSGTDAVGAGGGVPLGLHFRLEKGWKIYWRSPGDAGYPPSIDWKGSANMAGADIAWPTPLRFSVVGLETLGYKDEVVLPITVRVANTAEDLALRASVDYLVCDEVCIPVQSSLALDLPAGPGGVSEQAHLINRFSSQVPPLQSEAMPAGAGGIAIDRAGITQNDKGRETLRVTAVSADPLEKPDLFVAGPDGSVFGAPRVTLSPDGRSAVLDIPADTAGVEGGIAGKTISLTLADGDRAVERRMVPETILPPAGEQGGTPAVSVGLLAILGLALIGGLILNLMPCVLPVLSIKLLGVIRHGGGERRLVRIGFLASAAGIVSAFLVLAAALIVLKLSGAAVGWGIQFQQPWFLILMVLIVTLFACNLWGFFEVRLPRWIADAGEQTSHIHGLGGHFVSGVFATLLATPCSAPFLGTAVGFALSRGAFEIIAVFAALGVGLALPYLAVAGFPGLATRLPRPGPWMVTLRKVMGFALAATGVWLLTVLVAQVGMVAAGTVAALSLFAIFALYLRHRLSEAAGRTLTAALGVLALLAFLAPGLLASDGSDTAEKDNGPWVAFDEAAIPGLVAEGKLVFVDVTADWCITCQVNKRLVIYSDDVRARVFGKETVAMRADWTKPDDRIAAYLSRFGRYGIPFNAVYGPAAPEGIALPELLTSEVVFEAMDRAAGTSPPR